MLIKTYMIVTAILLLATSIKAQDIFICKNGNAAFFSEAPMENIDAKSDNMGSALNIKTKKMVFKVKMQTFQFKRALMQEHFNENYIESDKFPYTIFDGTIKEDLDLAQDGIYEVNVEGTLTIHGVTKDRTIPGTLTVKDGKITGKSEFWIKVADHEIEIPSMLMKNIAEEVLVKIDLVYTPKE